MTTETCSDSRILELTVDTRAAKLAREFVRETLTLWGREDLEGPATLAVSELVTNAVLHARSATRVTLMNYGDSIQVRVHDDHSGAPKLRDPEPDETGGRGILLVEALSAHWGIDNEIPGKTVWLDITRSSL